MSFPKNSRLSVCVLLGLTIAYGAANAQTTNLDAIQVNAGPVVEVEEPTAPVKITSDQIQKTQSHDVMRVLKQAPGVYVREEDGLGLRPNIGLRGTNPDRSKKIVLMQDGAPIAPAPYSAPAAYYTPSLGFTDSLNIYKGFSSVIYGPNSIGGAINYITTPIPDQWTTETELSGGSFSSWNSNVSTGGSTSWGGAFLQVERRQSSGFKELDTGEDTGFVQNRLLGKLRFHLPSKDFRAHFVDLRVGYGDENSNETYLGLAQSDFEKTPYRRYAASQRDEMTWDHQTYQMEHNYQLSQTGILETTLYRHEFHRVWDKFARFRDESLNVREVLDDPDGSNELFLDVLRGERDSDEVGTGAQIVLGRNERSYLSQGVQSSYSDEFEGGVFEHDVRLGARWHTDEIDRDHSYSIYKMESGEVGKATQTGVPSTNNKESAEATTFFANYDLSWRSWVLTGIGRAELARFQYLNQDSGEEQRRYYDVYLPGVSLLKTWGKTFSSRVSFNKAATLAGLDSQGQEAPERSDNFELEFKWTPERLPLQLQQTTFLNNYDNLTGTCSASSGCDFDEVGDQFSGGSAQILGSEFRLATAFQALWGWQTFQVNYTYLDASFQSRFQSESEVWGNGLVVEAGDPLPYVPKHQYSLVWGSEYSSLAQEFTLTWHGRMYDQSAQEGRRIVDPFGVVDWIFRYKFGRESYAFFKVDNLLDKAYAVSVRPLGYRPGRPRTFTAGLNYSW